MRDSRHADQRCRAIHRFLTLAHKKHLRILGSSGARRSHPLKQSARFSDSSAPGALHYSSLPPPGRRARRSSRFQTPGRAIQFARPRPMRQPVNAMPCTRSAQLRESRLPAVSIVRMNSANCARVGKRELLLTDRLALQRSAPDLSKSRRTRLRRPRRAARSPRCC